MQKNALLKILKDKYESYESAKRVFKVETLYEKRENSLKKFWKKCHQPEQTNELFALIKMNNRMQTRKK